jgi:hypothetical protein
MMESNNTTQTVKEQKQGRQPYISPHIETESLFESTALESQAKSGPRTTDPFDECFGEPFGGS